MNSGPQGDPVLPTVERRIRPLRGGWVGLLLLGIVGLTASQVQSLLGTWLRNAALVQLEQRWFERAQVPFEPACFSTGAFWQMESVLQPGNAQAAANHRDLTHLGRVFWLQGRCDEALAMWKQAVAIGEPGAAFELFRRGSYDALPWAVRQKLADLAYDYALKLIIDAKSQLAYQWMRRAISLSPKRDKALSLEGAYVRSGDLTATKELWQLMTDAYPVVDSEHWFALAKGYEQIGQWDVAAQTYIYGATLSSAPLEFWLQAGRAWEHISEWDRAVQAYDQAVSAAPLSVEANTSLGNVYRIQGKFDEAIRYLQLAQAAQADHFLPYYYLALVYYQSGDYVEARLYLEQALKWSPDNPWIMYQFAQLWYNGLLSPGIAESWLVNAIDHLAQPPPAWWIELGDWRMAQHRCAEADQAYTAARHEGVAEQDIEPSLAKYIAVCGSGQPPETN